MKILTKEEELEQKKIIEKYHEYLTKLWEADNQNLPLVKPEKWNIRNPDACQWIVWTVLSIQDEVKSSNAT